VLLEWTPERIGDCLRRGRSVHLLTNARAYPSADARALVNSAAAAAVAASPRPLPVLRGDSTLRGHVLEEYLAVRDALDSDAWPPLVLVPALPSAGRVTVNGVQYLERDGQRVPVDRTEYAADAGFAYSSARLLLWAEERSSGLFGAGHGVELHLRELRSTGPDAVVSAVQSALSASQPAAVALDAETNDDIETLAVGLERAITEAGEFVLRCGPALAGALGGATATEAAPFPAASSVLVVCGSYVPQSVRQLRALSARFPAAIVKVPPATLADAEARAFSSILGRVAGLFDDSGIAVLAVDGPPPPGLADLARGLQIANGLARLVAAVDSSDSLVVLKGGVTSAVVLASGLGAREADIVGPVVPGVALWRIRDPEERACLVVPGNVGPDNLLVELVERACSEAR
jgi:uncharacterized protein YgbK (DUF1537 family)